MNLPYRISLTILLVLIVGCARRSERAPTLLAHEQPATVSNSGAALAQGARGDLLTINTITISPVAIRDASTRASSTGRFDEIFKQEVNSGLDLQVVDDKGDGVLSVDLTTLHERVGGKMGADEPAAVGFEMLLTRARDGKVIWTSRYSKHDEAISSNLLTIPEKFGRGKTPAWLSADELFRNGVREAVRDLQSKRMMAFVGQH